MGCKKDFTFLIFFCFKNTIKKPFKIIYLIVTNFIKKDLQFLAIASARLPKNWNGIPFYETLKILNFSSFLLLFLTFIL